MKVIEPPPLSEEQKEGIRVSKLFGCSAATDTGRCGLDGLLLAESKCRPCAFRGIKCFAMDKAMCTILTDSKLSLEKCMNCRFRKPTRGITGGKSYEPKPEPKVYLQRGKLRFVNDE